MKREEVFSHFLTMIKTYNREEFSIDFYAQQLGMTSGELSEIIWEKSESTFLDWLDTMQKRA